MNVIGKLTVAAALLCGVFLSAAADTYAQAAKDLKCKGCVDPKDLDKNSVTTKKIDNRAVKPSKLSRPTGAAGVTEADVLDIGTNELINQVAVSIPGPGVVIVNASAYAEFDSADGLVDCGLTKAANINLAPFTRATGSGAIVSVRNAPIALTRSFKETSAGVYIYTLRCSPDTGDNVDIRNAIVTAIYAPTDILTTP